MSQHERGVHVDKDGKKTFVPLENNPEVFAQLVHQLGVSPKLRFYDIYSIDEEELLALIPRPVHAIIFISPADIYYKIREHDEGSEELVYDGSGESEPVIWFRQTIGHACGLIALLHSVCNGSARQYISPGSDLDELLKQCIPLKPTPRAQALHDSQALEKAHMSAAYKGDSKAPLSTEPNSYHFISFVRGKNGHLYELEGAWGHPVDRGLLSEDDDMLSDKALTAGIRRFIKLADGNMEFSMVALATDPGVE